MERQHLIHFHGETKEGLEEYLNNGGTLELGEIAVITVDGALVINSDEE